MTRDEAAKVIRASEFADIADALIPMLKPCARMFVFEENTKHRTAAEHSYLGGVPMLPEGTKWPVWDWMPGHMRDIKYLEEMLEYSKGLTRKEGEFNTTNWPEYLAEAIAKAPRGLEPLAFLGQVSLADVWKQTGLTGVAQSGTLAFFYDPIRLPWGIYADEKEAFRVIYCPADSHVCPIEPPADLKPQVRYAKRQVRFAHEWTLPSRPIVDRQGNQVELCYEESYYDLRELLKAPTDRDLERGSHRFMGHPRLVQNDMRVNCEMVRVGAPPPELDEDLSAYEAGAKEWELLMQFQSDPAWDWCDDEAIYFMIRRQDLDRLDFSNVWMVLQAT